MMDTIYALNAALPGIAVADGKLPADIQWMPPGRHTITPLVNGEPKTITVNVTADVGSRVAAALQAMRSKSAAGEGDLPFFDFDHEDREASAHPTEFYWAGDDPRSGGIRAKLEWTEAGKAAVLGKTFRRFSPSFGLTQSGDIAIAGVNLGGLVNKAAFQKISPIWSRNGGDRNPQQETNTQENMTPEQEKKLADVVTAVAALTTKVDGLVQAKAAAPEPGKILTIETRLASIEALTQANAKSAAKGKVQAAIQAGKIPAQAKEVIEQWENLLAVDAKNEALLDALPVNPALAKIVQASGGTSAGAGSTLPGEHAFVVKAKEYAKANSIADTVEAQAKFAETAEGQELYRGYIEHLAPRNKQN